MLPWRLLRAIDVRADHKAAVSGYAMKCTIWRNNCREVNELISTESRNCD